MSELVSLNPHQIDLSDSRILVVDDEPAATRILTRVLKQFGFTQVLTTNDPREAAELYRNFSPDAVVLDLNMPDLDGFEVMSQLVGMEGKSFAPILVLTGESDVEQRTRALQSGARDFLQKPFLSIELISRLRNLLEVRRLYRRTEEERQWLAEQVHLRTVELATANLEVIRRLTRAAEYRDDDTGNHIHRISQYTAVLARAFGLPPDKVELLSHASAMHDVGKIGISDSILLKKGKLSSEEWQTMKTHVDIGVAILAGGSSELLVLAEEVARTHHERWDGSGYPAGLVGEQIPLPGRLVAVCDVFDALTSERPYKTAWPTHLAVAEIQRSSGSHFDPSVVELFTRSLHELLEIRAIFK